MADTFRLYSDGGSRGNPGLAAIGGVLLSPDGKIVFSYSRFIGVTTNNIAEYTALIEGLRLSHKNNIHKISCMLDSELVVKQLNGEYRIKDGNLKLLSDVVGNYRAKFDLITFSYVPRAKNKEADKLVNKALNEVS